jgi:hypothetical protein
MQWVAQQFATSAPVSTPASKLPNSSPPPAFMKLAHVTGPLTGDAFVFVLSKMKQDGFTAVLVTVSLDDWRLQRLMIVSRFAQHEQLLPVGTQSLLIDTIGLDTLFILLIRSAASLQRIRTSRCMHISVHWHLSITSTPIMSTAFFIQPQQSIMTLAFSCASSSKFLPGWTLPHRSRFVLFI